VDLNYLDLLARQTIVTIVPKNDVLALAIPVAAAFNIKLMNMALK
jgi:hypothetical protein